MKTAKARVFTFDLECPDCGGYLESPEGNGSVTWSIHERAPLTAKCSDCGSTSKVPKQVKSALVQIEKAETN